MNLRRSIVLCAMLSLTMAWPASAITDLGTGGGSLIGNDLTDFFGTGSEAAYAPPNLGGFTAEFFGDDEPNFNPPNNEGAFNVFDNQKGGGQNKWCCNNANGGDGVHVGANFTNTLGAVQLTHFTITSDNDVGTDRDPDVWSIQGSNDGSTWTNIYSYNMDGDSVFDNFGGSPDNRTIRFDGSGADFATPAFYTHLRYLATSSVNNANHALGELEFFGNVLNPPEIPAGVPVNVGRLRDGMGKPATQTSQLGGFGPNLALDGNLGNFTHTLNSDTNPSWEVDLGATVPISTVELNNRGDGCCQSRFRDITVSVLDHNGVEVFNSGLLNPENVLGGGGTGGPPNLVVDLQMLNGGPILGRTVVVHRTPDDDLSGTGGVGNADEGRVLSLGEVQVSALNLALKPDAMITQSSTHPAGPAERGADGDLENFSHTSGSGNDPNPFWEIDLGEVLSLDSVIIHNRGDGCCQDRLRDIVVDVFDDMGNLVFTSPELNDNNGLNNPLFLAVDFHELLGDALNGQTVRITRFGIGTANGGNVLQMGEVQIFGARVEAAVPEPASATLLGLAGLALLRGRRRKRA